MFKFKKLPGIFLISIIAFVFITPSCEEATEIADDAMTISALENVDFTHDSLTIDIGLPEGALESDKTFEELLEEDSAKYANPANYTMELSNYLTADNTGEDARDAKFDGMRVNFIMDNLNDHPIEAESGAFEIMKNETKTVSISGGIDLETHRLPGLYIFNQTVDGEDLDTKILIELLYDIGGKEGFIELPEIQKNIPTRASDETKEFLSEVLESGIFEE